VRPSEAGGGARSLNSLFLGLSRGAGASGLSPAGHGNDPGRNLGPVAWSPDGRKMLLSRVGPNIGYDSRKVYIVVMNADASGLRRLTSRIAAVKGPLPSWSPRRQPRDLRWPSELAP
jgi:hypothetical protein